MRKIYVRAKKLLKDQVVSDKRTKDKRRHKTSDGAEVGVTISMQRYNGAAFHATIAVSVRTANQMQIARGNRSLSRGPQRDGLQTRLLTVYIIFEFQVRNFRP